MYFKRILVTIFIIILPACDRPTPTTISKYNIGVVSYGKGETSLQQYTDFKNYLATQLNSIIEIEPVYNEVKALQQISNQKWDLVFAPPGLAAIAISRYNYEPMLPLEGRDKTRSIIVVNRDAPFKQRQDLSGQAIALGQKGSATGYYLPLYNLYGLQFSELLFAPTPKDVLQLLSSGKATVGALSLADYNLHRRSFPPNQFKVIHVDNHDIPPGAILIGDRFERNQQEQIRKILTATPSFIASSAGFLPNEQLPSYDYLIKVIERVQEISQQSRFQTTDLERQS